MKSSRFSVASTNHLFAISIFFVFSLFLLSANALASTENHDITLVYTGNLDGELEPCGCSEGGNKGGLKRRAKALDELRKEDPKLYLISTGGLLISEVSQDTIKSKYILTGMEALDYDAIGIQWKDLSFGPSLLSGSKLPFVISNNSGQTFFNKRSIDHKHTTLTFFNWLDPNRNPQKNMGDSIADDDVIALAENLKTAKSKKQLTILSTTLPLKLAQRRLPLNDVDILLIRAKYEQIGEPQQIKNMLVLQPGSRGMRIGKLNLTVSVNGNLLKWKHTVIPLPPEVGDAARMADWYDAYNREVKADYERNVAMRMKIKTGDSPFSGESACKNCHLKEHEIWSNTRHAEAFYALQDVNKAFDPDCIQCHTVGFNTAGGFLTPAITESLMHVQCENCHGAARAHAQSAGKKPVTNKNWSNEKICQQCHIQKHSPEFDFNNYWAKIKHGNK